MSELNSTIRILKAYGNEIKRGDYQIDVDTGELVSEVVVKRLVELIKSGKLDENTIKKILDSHVTTRITIDANWKFEKQIINWLKKQILKYLSGEENELAELINSGRLKCYTLTDYDDITLEEEEKVICSYKMDSRDIEKVNEIVEETIKEVLKL
ncbi:MAG: hypothetical protein ABIK73_07890 [candidate division WOR-3 bacterium]